MIALLLLLAGAFWIGLFMIFGSAAVKVVALGCAVLVCTGVVAGEIRYIQDRRTAYRRWAKWADDA